MAGYINKYQRTYTSFAGTDIVASVTLPGIGSIILGTIQTVSYSLHRDKFPARTLGRISPKGYSYGGRTIAGSLIFTVFHRHVLKDIMEGIVTYRKSNDLPNLSAQDQLLYSEMYYRMLTDEIPPFDINITMMNEYGQMAKLNLLGVMIVDEGQVMSIEDMVTENTMSFIARDIVPMTPIDYTLNNNEINSEINYPWS